MGSYLHSDSSFESKPLFNVRHHRSCRHDRHCTSSTMAVRTTSPDRSRVDDSKSEFVLNKERKEDYLGKTVLDSKISEIDLMKERFTKLLLGEDILGSGKGFCTTLAISNAITNLCGVDFLRLALVMREILDSFTGNEFWYVDQGIGSQNADGLASFRQTLQRYEKWRILVPRVPAGGLGDNSRNQLNHTLDCTIQILEVAMAINNNTLSEMGMPYSYLDILPKNERACLGDLIYRYITSDQFSIECLLDFLDLSSEHVVEIANRVEAAIYVWRRRSHSKPPINPNRSTTKSPWEMVNDLMVDGYKREFLAERAKSLLLCLKQRFPASTQTTLDTNKI